MYVCMTNNFVGKRPMGRRWYCSVSVLDTLINWLTFS